MKWGVSKRSQKRRKKTGSVVPKGGVRLWACEIGLSVPGRQRNTEWRSTD